MKETISFEAVGKKKNRKTNVIVLYLSKEGESLRVERHENKDLSFLPYDSLKLVIDKIMKKSIRNILFADYHKDSGKNDYIFLMDVKDEIIKTISTGRGLSPFLEYVNTEIHFYFYGYSELNFFATPCCDLFTGELGEQRLVEFLFD